MDPKTSVTPEEVVTAILVEFENSTVPGYYANYVHNIFRVYLFRDDFASLRGFQERIREEAARALQEELNRLNRPQKAFLALPFQKQARPKRYESLGPWTIEFLSNEDDNAAENRLLVHSDGSAPPETAVMDGPPTIRVGLMPVPDDSLTKTQRTGFAPAPSSNATAYARLTYDDDSGSHEFDMVKDTIKIGRGGPNEWVDLKLLSSKDVSREHCQIRRDPATGKFFIKDLSTFGTTVGGARVPSSDLNVEAALPAKASIHLADVLTIQFKALKTK